MASKKHGSDIANVEEAQVDSLVLVAELFSDGGRLSKEELLEAAYLRACDWENPRLEELEAKMERFRKERHRPRASKAAR